MCLFFNDEPEYQAISDEENNQHLQILQKQQQQQHTIIRLINQVVTLLFVVFNFLLDNRLYHLFVIGLGIGFFVSDCVAIWSDFHLYNFFFVIASVVAMIEGLARVVLMYICYKCSLRLFARTRRSTSIWSSLFGIGMVISIALLITCDASFDTYPTEMAVAFAFRILFDVFGYTVILFSVWVVLNRLFLPRQINVDNVDSKSSWDEKVKEFEAQGFEWQTQILTSLFLTMTMFSVFSFFLDTFSRDIFTSGFEWVFSLFWAVILLIMTMVQNFKATEWAKMAVAKSIETMNTPLYHYILTDHVPKFKIFLIFDPIWCFAIIVLFLAALVLFVFLIL